MSGKALTSPHREWLIEQRAIAVERQHEVRALIRDHPDRVKVDDAVYYRLIVAMAIGVHQRAHPTGDEADEAL